MLLTYLFKGEPRPHWQHISITLGAQLPPPHPRMATCPSQPPGVRWSLLPGLSSCPIAFPLAHLPWEALTLPAPAPISCRISDPPFPPGAWLSFCKYVFLLITCVSVFVTLMELWAP